MQTFDNCGYASLSDGEGNPRKAPLSARITRDSPLGELATPAISEKYHKYCILILLEDECTLFRHCVFMYRITYLTRESLCVMLALHEKPDINCAHAEKLAHELLDANSGLRTKIRRALMSNDDEARDGLVELVKFLMLTAHDRTGRRTPRRILGSVERGGSCLREL